MHLILPTKHFYVFSEIQLSNFYFKLIVDIQKVDFFLMFLQYIVLLTK